MTAPRATSRRFSVGFQSRVSSFELGTGSEDSGILNCEAKNPHLGAYPRYVSANRPAKGVFGA